MPALPIIDPELAVVARSTMAGVAEARALALAANAPKYFEEQFREVDESLIKASSDLENNNGSIARSSRDELVKDYSDLELKSIQQESIGSAQKTIYQAVIEGAEENSARSLAIAKQSVANAMSFISADRHNKSEISRYSEIANTNSNHLLEVARQVKVARKTDPETMVLRSETQKKVIANARLDQASKELEIGKLATEAGELSTRNQKLEAGKLSIEKLDKAKARFSGGEADVYRDGNKLVIRMKGLAFPSGKSTLSSRNFVQLAKVQEVIKDLGESQVKVEGHTDAIGSQIENQRLSVERAQAIGDYFAANGLNSTDIETVGLGDSNPIAPNKSKEGRAQNRRVDVIVTPK